MKKFLVISALLSLAAINGSIFAGTSANVTVSADEDGAVGGLLALLAGGGGSGVAGDETVAATAEVNAAGKGSDRAPFDDAFAHLGAQSWPDEVGGGSGRIAAEDLAAAQAVMAQGRAAARSDDGIFGGGGLGAGDETVSAPTAKSLRGKGGRKRKPAAPIDELIGGFGEGLGGGGGGSGAAVDVTRLFKCPIDGCGRSFKHKKHIKEHMRNHTGEKPYGCRLCNFRATRSSVIKEHERTHTGEKPYKCRGCGRGFAQSGNYHEHERKCMLGARVPTDEGAAGGGGRGLGGGGPSAASEELAVAEDFAGGATAGAANEATGRRFGCSHEGCGRSFKHKKHLNVHMRNHTGEKPYACSRCDFRAATSSVVKEHERTHTGEKPYRCRGCGGGFAQSGKYHEHEKKCMLGARVLTDEEAADRAGDLCEGLAGGGGGSDAAVDDGEKFECPIPGCGRSFKHKKHLKVHMRNHTGKKPYACRHCEFRATRKSIVTDHERIHTGEKPYRCRGCGGGFAQSGNYHKHERKCMLGARVPTDEGAAGGGGRGSGTAGDEGGASEDEDGDRA